MAQDFDALPLEERARHYRFMAQEALRASTGAQTDESRAEFLSIARGWHMLAIQVENYVADIEPESANDPASWFEF